MTALAISLQKAVFTALAGDAGLQAAIGGRIFDHAPASAPFPYLTFGRLTVFDWSADAADGQELFLTVNAWSKARGKKEALELVELARARLHEAALEMEGGRLVNLRAESAETAFVDDIDVHHARLRLRAAVEPAGQ